MHVHFPTLIVGVALIVSGLLLRHQASSKSESSHESGRKIPRRP